MGTLGQGNESRGGAEDANGVSSAGMLAAPTGGHYSIHRWVKPAHNKKQGVASLRLTTGFKRLCTKYHMSQPEAASVASNPTDFSCKAVL